MKIENGVMVMKNGMGWGLLYSDGRSTSYGWVIPENAIISNPKYCKNPQDLTYENSRDVPELCSGKLVSVQRTTSVSVL